MPYSLLKVSWCFERTCGLHLQGWRISYCLPPASLWLLAWLLWLWRWNVRVPLKHWLTFSGLPDVISQRIEFQIRESLLYIKITVKEIVCDHFGTSPHLRRRWTAKSIQKLFSQVIVTVMSFFPDNWLWLDSVCWLIMDLCVHFCEVCASPIIHTFNLVTEISSVLL
jgi:hypothetical protein